MRAPHTAAATTDRRVLTALSRGPLTQQQIDQQLGFAKYGAKASLARLIACGLVVKEPSEELASRQQYRKVRA